LGQTIRWGIIGLGAMADTFANELGALRGEATIQAVASSSLDRATAFAEAHAAVAAYDSVDRLVADNEVDVVYVATRHDGHGAAALAAIEAGRSVLVEKPFSPTAAETRTVLDRAAARGVLAMEAMWTLCLPVYDHVRGWLRDGRIGEPRQLVARFGFRSVVGESAARLRDPAAGGGSLLDVGVYPIALAQLVFGPTPNEVVATGRMAGGVDEQLGAVLRFPGGGIALIGSAIEVETDYTAVIDGTDGRITIPEFWRAKAAVLETSAATERAEALPDGAGWASQACHVHELVARGATESPLVTHAATVARAEICDAIREILGTASVPRR
jgi:predicted dehydrogenase